jgi:hypothetical protein
MYYIIITNIRFVYHNLHFNFISVLYFPISSQKYFYTG